MTSLFYYHSPVGVLTIAGSGQAVTGLWIEGQKYFASTLGTDVKEEYLSVFDAVRSWLDAYFAGAPLLSLPPLAPQGTPFRQAVWKRLLEIPFGKTATYGELTRSLRESGIPAAPQAVGGAVGHNPISILIPCHRVVGAGGSLTGYAGGIAVKKKLLELEGMDMTGLYIPKHGTAL